MRHQFDNLVHGQISKANLQKRERAREQRDRDVAAAKEQLDTVTSQAAARETLLQVQCPVTLVPACGFWSLCSRDSDTPAGC